jgi:type IV pilus assembly protein PilW
MKHFGFSLVELMVSLTLGLMITAGVITVFTSVQQNYQTTQGITMMQENSHFMRLFLTEAVNDIGHLNGCHKDIPVGNSVTVGGQPYSFSLSGAIQGYEIMGTDSASNTTQSSSSAFPNTLSTSSFIAGSDFFEIQTLQDMGSMVVDNTQSSSQKLRVINDTDTTETKDVFAYVAQDCTEAAIFYSTNIYRNSSDVSLGHPTNYDSTGLVQTFQNCITKAAPPYVCPSATLDLSYQAPANAKVYKTDHFVYGIKDVGDGEEGIYSLVEIDLQGKTDDNERILLSGLNSFQVTYGVMANESNAIKRVERYVSAANMLATDWPNVGAIKINARLTALSESTGAITSINRNTSNDVYTDIEQVITLRNRVFSE